MHDEFLHRLRREPSREFAARLQARLRQSSKPLRPRPPSRLRTLITLLLLSGTAFAVTFVAMRGVPKPLLRVYQHAAGRIAAESTSTLVHGGGNQAGRDGLQWGASGSRSTGATAARNEPAHTLTTETKPPSLAAASSAGSAGSVAMGAPAPGSQEALRMAASWAAYLYAAPIAEIINRSAPAASTFGAPHIEVTVQDSNDWPGSICSSGAHAPDMAYTSAPVGTVSNRPCPGSPSGNVPAVIAIPAGYEAVALARSPLYGELDLTRRQIFLALAKWVPGPRGRSLQENHSTTWRQIDAALGPEPIEFLGPSLSSPAGRSMIELLMEGGCKSIPWIAALEATDRARYTHICRTVRTDGVYVEVPWLATSRLLSEPNAIGIFGLWSLSHVDVNNLIMSRLDGVEPTSRGIESGAYPGSRGLYLYVNRARVPPNVVVRFLRDGGWARSSAAAFIPPSQPNLRAAIAEARAP